MPRKNDSIEDEAASADETMVETMPSAPAEASRVDSELLRQLDAAETTSEPVEAVFLVRPETDAELGASAERVEEIVHQVLERAERESGGHALQVNVFRYLSSFAIRGEPELIRSLMAQPEIAQSVANRQPDEPMAVPPTDAKVSGPAQAEMSEIEPKEPSVKRRRAKRRDPAT